MKFVTGEIRPASESIVRSCLSFQFVYEIPS